MKKMGVVLLLIIMLVLTGCAEKEMSELDYCSDNFSLEDMRVKALEYVSVNYPGAELVEFGYITCNDEETRIYGDIYLEGELVGAIDINGISGDFGFIPLENLVPGEQIPGK
jgi:hypothetical protein